MNFDVTIVGSGVAGASAALHLAHQCEFLIIIILKSGKK